MPSLEAYKAALDYSYAPGVFPSMECLEHRPEQVRRLLVHSSAAGREGVGRLTARAEALGVRVEEADRALARISGKENCFAAAVFGKFSDTLAAGKPHVVLHHPGDSGNVGTILRTALGFGVEDVAMIRPCADPFDPKTVRASMGSLFSLRIHLYDTFEDYRADYPDRMLYPFMLDASLPLGEVLNAPRPEAWSLIFGNEGSGLPAEFAGFGQPVRIESNDRVDSLNLAVAAAIAIYRFMIPGNKA
ncbi:MAG: TrmH family RNA methyltransferase [Clostridiales bacterium]|nr:TrmH family RNA methyltransferase [Clostridiales bacterium]